LIALLRSIVRDDALIQQMARRFASTMPGPLQHGVRPEDVFSPVPFTLLDQLPSSTLTAPRATTTEISRELLMLEHYLWNVAMDTMDPSTATRHDRLPLSTVRSHIRQHVPRLYDECAEDAFKKSQQAQQGKVQNALKFVQSFVEAQNKYARSPQYDSIVSNLMHYLRDPRYFFKFASRYWAPRQAAQEQKSSAATQRTMVLYRGLYYPVEEPRLQQSAGPDLTPEMDDELRRRIARHNELRVRKKAASWLDTSLGQMLPKYVQEMKHTYVPVPADEGAVRAWEGRSVVLSSKPSAVSKPS
jgi:hypothetical protein